MARIDQLNGAEVLEIPSEGSTLLVGGGPDLFTVMAMVGPDDFFHVVGDAAAEGEVDMLMGGTLTPWPRRLCASREQAITAVRHWLASAVMDPGLQWERQGGGSLRPS